MAGDNLKVTGIQLDSRDLRRGVIRAERELDRLERKVEELEREVGQAERGFDGMGRAVAGAAAAFAAFETARRATGFIVSTNRELQQLEAQLISVAGGVDEAAQAFQLITDFAAETPFQIQDLVQSFTQFQAVGVEPTAEMLRDFGNFAAAFGRNILDFTNAVTRAATGETEALKAFGVVARSEADRLRVTFRGTTREVERDFDSVIQLFRDLARENFAGGMARQMDTLNGQISNLEDLATLAAKKVGDEGLNQALGELIETLQDAITTNDEFARSLGRTLANGVEVANGTLELFIEHTDAIANALKVVVGIAAGRGILALGRQLVAAAAGARTMSAALLGLVGGPHAAIASLAGIIGVELVGNLITARSETEKLADELERLSGAAIASGPEAIRARLAELRQTEAGLVEQGQRFAGVRNLTRRSGTADTGFGRNAAANLEENRAKLAEVRQEIARLESRLAETAETQSTVTEGTKAQADAVDKLIASLRAERDELLFTERELLERKLTAEGATEAEKELALAIFDTTAELVRQAEAEEDAARARERRVEVAERAMEATREELRQMKERARLRSEEFQNQLRFAEILEAERQANEAAEAISRALTDPLADVVLETENVVEAFRDMVDGILRELVRLQVQRPVANLLGDLIGSALGGGIPDAPGPIDAPSPPDVSVPDVSEPIPALEGFATGGSFTVGGSGGTDSQLVAFNATPGELVEVTPRSKGGGEKPIQVTQHLHFPIYGLDGPSIRRVLAEQMPFIQAGVAAAAERSSRYRQTLREGR